MKISINKHAQYGEAEILINCAENDSSIDQIVELLQESTIDFIGKKEDKKFVFKAKEVYYIESIDDQCFLYTKNDVYDCKYRLYEIENKHSSFTRVNKNIVVNYKKIKFFKSSINGRLDATLNNGDRVEISRTYVGNLKSLLGGQVK
ncbi:MAG: LytTR family transcriptional regulator [Firmicutes bacterium]|nr:LytTR family transcriptional regulator [Bacillota bacterium]